MIKKTYLIIIIINSNYIFYLQTHQNSKRNIASYNKDIHCKIVPIKSLNIAKLFYIHILGAREFDLNYHCASCQNL